MTLANIFNKAGRTFEADVESLTVHKKIVFDKVLYKERHIFLTLRDADRILINI